MTEGTKDRYVNTGGSGSGGNVVVTNFPADFPDAAVAAALANILTALGTTLNVDIQNASVTVDDGGQSLTVDGTVAVSNFPASTEISNDAGNPIPVSGTVSVSEPVTVDGTVDVGNFPAVQPVSDNGSSLTVDGSVAVSNFPAVQPVSDNGGSLTVDGTVAVTDGGGSITVDGPLTDAQLRAAPVPVSGTVSVTEPVSVDDNGGTLTTDAGITAEVTAVGGALGVFSNMPIDVSLYRWASFQLTGTWSGTINYEGSNDASTWFPLGFSDVGVTSTIPAASTTGNTLRHGPLNVKFFRLRFASYTSGTATAIIELIQSPSIPTHTGITTIVPSTGAANLGKAEDAAHTTGDVGVAVWGVRNDALATRTDADGDYSPISVDGSGRLRARVMGEVADGAALTSVNPVLAGGQDGTNVQSLRTDTTGNLGTYPKTVVGAGGDAGTQFALPADESGSNAVGMPSLPYWYNGSVFARARGDVTNGLDVDVTRVPAPLSTTGGGTEATALRVTVATDSTGVLSVDDNGGSLTVDGTVAVSNFPATQPVSGTVTADTELPAAAALADNTANPTAPAVGAFGMVWDGSTWDRMPGTSADGVLVNLGANNDVVISDGGNVISVDDAGGSLTVDGSVAVSGVTPGTSATSLGKAEDSPHATGDVGVMALGVVNTAQANLAATEGDYVPIAATQLGAIAIAGTGSGSLKQIITDDSGRLIVEAVTLSGVIKDNSGDVCTVKSAVVDFNTTNGDFTIVAAVASKKIRVINLMISINSSTAVNIKLRDGTGGATLSGTYSMLGQTTVTEVATTGGWLFETSAGTALVGNVAAATARSVRVNYIEVD